MTTPSWLDTQAYPFAPRLFETAVGNMHYIDEGSDADTAVGDPIVLLHGNPGWSFEYREIIGSSDWLESLWAQRDKIKHIPTAVVWGDSDIAFKEGELKVWTDLMENHTLTILHKIGHYPPEEAPAEAIKVLKE